MARSRSPQSPHGPRLRRVVREGLGLQIHEWGDDDAPTIVLVHGYPDTSTVWTPVAEALAGRYHVVAYDVRGAGASGVPDHVDDYQLPELVADLAAVIDAVSPDDPIHLAAHDWGSIQCWEAVCDEGLTGRIASYTSISGPPLDHVARWVRDHRTSLAGLRQARRSWYVAFFSTPRLPELAWRNLVGRRFDRVLGRVEGVATSPDWPAATVAEDGALGVNLYRANVGERLARPQERHTDVPVQLIVPTEDRYVTPALLEGLEVIAPDLRRREIDDGHWVIRTQPEAVASWIDEHISSIRP